MLPLLPDLLPACRACVEGRYAIALAGAHAKGYSDSGSDLDLYLLADRLRPVEERTAVVAALGGTDLYQTPALDAHPWGGSLDFTLRGTRVETTVRSIRRMERVVAECAAGQVMVEPALWTVQGYYPHVYLAEASFLQPLDDPWGVFPRLKAGVEPYPEAFRRAAIAFFLPRAGYWMESFHYLSAIERGDFVYTSGILQQSLHNLVQSLFPLNRKFFAGDKRLALQLTGLPFCPAALRDSLAFLLGAHPAVDDLRRQRALFQAALAETRARAGEEGG
jgi:hypothetical protein